MKRFEAIRKKLQLYWGTVRPYIKKFFDNDIIASGIVLVLFWGLFIMLPLWLVTWLWENAESFR